MDIFLTKMHGFTTGGLYSPPRSHVRHVFFNGFAHFILRVLDCVTEAQMIGFIWKRKSYTPRMAWGWVNNRIIFIFGWTNPFRVKAVLPCQCYNFSFYSKAALQCAHNCMCLTSTDQIKEMRRSHRATPTHYIITMDQWEFEGVLPTSELFWKVCYGKLKSRN